MRAAISALVVLFFGLALLAPTGEGADGSGGSAPEAPAAQVQRGEYLVHSVAMCVQCHTPRNEQGRLQMEQLLAGRPVPIESPVPGVDFAVEVPKIAGLPAGWSRDDVVRFLQSGETPHGEPPLPPMPPFRMNAQDAAAVAAYLESLR